MVLTRSGKSTGNGSFPSHNMVGSRKVLGSSKVRFPPTTKIAVHTGAPVEIFCDVNADPCPNLSRANNFQDNSVIQPPATDENCQMVTKSSKRLLDDGTGNIVKKSRVLGDATSSTLNTLSVAVSPSAKDVKKVCLSLEEKAMNGAPEGDLYDVVLLDDNQLLPFSDESMAQTELSKALSQYNTTSIWAEKYEVVTTLRRVISHHSNCILDGNHMQALVTCALDQVSSLRSSNVRNGLMCLQKAAQVYQERLWSESSSQLIFTALLNKTGSGPKFLCDAAFESCRASSESCSISLLFSAIYPMISHKNIEVSAKSVEILVLAVMRNNSIFNQGQENGVTSKILTSLGAALSAKKAQAKERAKEALVFVKKTMGEEAFDKFLDNNIPGTIGGEIKRELCKTVPAVVAVNKPSLSKFSSSFTKPVTGTALKFIKPAVGVPPRKPWEKVERPIEKIVPLGSAENQNSMSNDQPAEVPMLDILDGLENLV
jgi:hypothetical protein